MTIDEANESSTERIALACAVEMLNYAANIVKCTNRESDISIRGVQVGRAAACIRNEADSLYWISETMKDHPDKSREYLLELLAEKQADRHSSEDSLDLLVKNK